MTVDKVVSFVENKLKELEVGEDFILEDNYPPRFIDKVLAELSGNDGIQIGRDWNGCDLDWSVWFEYEGMRIYSWGSAYDGNVGFEREV